MDPTPARPIARTLTGPDMLAYVVEAAREIGVRELARRTDLQKSALAMWLHDPEQIRMGAFLRIVQEIGAAPQLVVVPLPPTDVGSRRQRARYQRRSPAERGELPSSPPPGAPGGEAAQENP